MKQYRYLDLLINIFVVVLIVSNLIAPKFVAAGWFRFSAGQMAAGSHIGADHELSRPGPAGRSWAVLI